MRTRRCQSTSRKIRAMEAAARNIPPNLPEITDIGVNSGMEKRALPFTRRDFFTGCLCFHYGQTKPKSGSIFRDAVRLMVVSLP